MVVGRSLSIYKTGCDAYFIVYLKKPQFEHQGFLVKLLNNLFCYRVYHHIQLQVMLVKNNAATNLKMKNGTLIALKKASLNAENLYINSISYIYK